MRPNGKLRVEDLINYTSFEHTTSNQNESIHLSKSNQARGLVGTWHWDLVTKETVGNGNWMQLLGFEKTGISDITSLLAERIHPDDLPIRQELLSKYVNGELNHYSFQFRIRHKDGSWIWVHDRGKIVADNLDGEALWMSGESFDISELKIAETSAREYANLDSPEVREKNAALRKSMELLKKEVVLRRQAEQKITKALKEEKETTKLRSKIISCISHEFKTPLTAILSSTQLIELNLEPNPSSRIIKHINQIESSIQHMNSMISDISFMEKMGIGQIVVTKNKIDLTEFLEDIVKEISLKHEMPKVLFQIDNNIDKVISDRKLLRQILRNLFSNSIKYNKDNNPVLLIFKKTKGGFQLQVKDTGLGIPESEQERIFEYFFRAENIGNIEGTGVGLAIVKSATEMLKGTIEFESKEGAGTTFTITLPD